jgi:peptidyl-prolyl cis-trans isomerase SurA
MMIIGYLLKGLDVKKLTFLLVAALFIGTSVAGVKNVAVVETEVDAQSKAVVKLSSAEVREITGELRRAAIKNLPRDKYNIMTTETVIAQGSAVVEQCDGENCVVVLGSRIGADFIVRGTIRKIQTRFSLSVEMYETENGNLVASSDPVRSENIGELIEKSAAACAKMYKAFADEQSKSKVVPASADSSIQARPALAQSGAVSTEPAPTPAVAAATQSKRPDSTAVAAMSKTADESEADAEAEDAERASSDQPDARPPRMRPIALGRPGHLDGIAAVVGDEIVLRSELEAYAYMRLTAIGKNPDSIDTKALLDECLNDLIDNKVLLVRAMTDSTINVRNDEVESTLNNHINAILRQNNITMEQLEAQLRIQQGSTMARFKTEMRRAIREQLYKQKLQQGYYFSTRINRRDVERFFAKYADSLPEVGESFELMRLSLRLAPQDSVRQAAFDKIRAAKREIDAGLSFEEAAKKYSESPEGASGGDLGFLAKGSTTELAFEERAFSLPIGRASEPFETRLGFHIIKVEEKKGMSVRIRHILVRCAPTEGQREALVARLDSLRAAIKDRAGFEAAAREMSVDNVTRARGGSMGWLTLLEMQPAVRNAVQGLEAGRISAVLTDGNIFSVYMVANRADSRRLTLENDYALIAEKARDIFAQQQLLDNVKKWREKVFIDVRM